MEYDVVIVLGNGKDTNLLTEQGINRVNACLTQYKERLTKRVCFSGITASIMRNFIGEEINFEDIYIEDLSEDTVGNAVFTKLNFAIPKGWKNILVVSSDYHIPRVKEIFNFVYGNDFNLSYLGTETSQVGENKKELESLEAFRETFKNIKPGDDKAIVRRLFEKHPLYVGRQDLQEKFVVI